MYFDNAQAAGVRQGRSAHPRKKHGSQDVGMRQAARYSAEPCFSKTEYPVRQAHLIHKGPDKQKCRNGEHRPVGVRGGDLARQKDQTLSV